MRERLRSTSRRQLAGGAGRDRERKSTARRRQSAGDVGREREQAAAADALQQQVDEYLASFDPEKPLYQDGWAIGEMQEKFQQKLRFMRNLCGIVCSERWYTDGEYSDPALHV